MVDAAAAVGAAVDAAAAAVGTAVDAAVPDVGAAVAAAAVVPLAGAAGLDGGGVAAGAHPAIPITVAAAAPAVALRKLRRDRLVLTCLEPFFGLSGHAV